MREFIFYSKKARTSGNFKDLMKAGRIDIVCNVIIQTLFLSHKLRDNIHLHLVFHGPPNKPRHLEIISNKLDKNLISKKDIAGLLKRMLYKCIPNKKIEVFPGCFIEEKSFQVLLKELERGGKKILILDSKGRNIRGLSNNELQDSMFVLGDDDGLPRKELKRYEKVSIGRENYFSSQTIIIINNELDFRRII